MAEEIRYDADEANRLANKLTEDAASQLADSYTDSGVRVTGGLNLAWTSLFNKHLKESVSTIRSDKQRYAHKMSSYSERLKKATNHTAQVEESITMQLHSKRNEIESFDVHEI